MKLFKVTFLFSLLVWNFGQAQLVNFATTFHHLTAENGLPRAEIYHVFQDTKGYMWFSTDAGVVRFDGYYFKTFGTEEGLLSSVVFESYEDPFGKIWFITLSNELCYFENDKIIKYKYNNVIKARTGESTSVIKNLFVNKNGDVFYSMSQFGFIKIDNFGQVTSLHKTPLTCQITRVNDKDIPSFLGETINTGTELTTKDVFSVFHSIGKKKILIGRFYSGNGVRYVKGNGTLEFSIVNGSLIDLKTERIIAKNVNKCIIDIYENNTLWLLGENGAQKCTYINGILTYGTTYLSGNYITSLCWDSEGGMWFSTLKNGVFYTSNNNVLHASTNSGLKRKSITGIAEFGGDMYFCFLGGYQKIGSKSWFNQSDGSIVLSALSKSNLIISTSDYTALSRKGSTIFLPHTRDISVNNEKIYFGSARIFSYDILSTKIDTIYNSYRDFSSSRQNFFRSICVSPTNQVIVGGRFGITRLKNGKLINDFKWSHSYDVTDICFTNKFGMVLATNNNGIIINQLGKPLRIVNSKNGLASNKVRCLLELENGLLIIGTNNGINYMFPNQNKPLLISVNQGIKNSNVQCLYANAKFVFVGTEDGVYCLEKSIFKYHSAPSNSQMYITDLEIDGMLMENFGKTILLPYQTGRIRVRFRTTNYKNWADKSYQYRLSHEEDWIDINSPEIFIYKPLGKFDLEVRYKDENENWSDSTFLLSCSVRVPFWKKWYFVVFVSFLTGLGIIFWLNHKQKIEKRRLLMDNEMLSLEQRMQNARMNPHFVFNVLNSIHSFIVFGDKDSAEKFLVKFSELMRNTLNETLEGSISIENELSILDKYLELEQLRHDNAFYYQIDSHIENELLKIPTMIIQPVVENALIHGVSSLETGGLVTIHLSIVEDKMLIAKVFNNGMISENQLSLLEKTGLKNAIGITKKRLLNYNTLLQSEHYGMKIEKESVDKTGVTITLTIPLI